LSIGFEQWVAGRQLRDQHVEVFYRADVKGLIRIDLFRDGKTDDFPGRFDHCFLYLHHFPVVVGDAVPVIDGIDAEETDVGLYLADAGDGFAADGDTAILRDLIPDEDHVDKGMVAIFEDYRETAGYESGLEILGKMPCQLDQRGAACGGDEHVVLDEGGGFAGDQLFLRMGIDGGGGMAKIAIGKGEGAAMDLDQLLAVGQLLEIAADGVFGYFELGAEACGEDLVVEVHLV